MGIADDIKKLGEDIFASYDGRAKAIGTLVKDTRKTLKGFDAENKEMADNLKEGLEKGETGRLKNFKNMMGDIYNGIKDIENDVENKLKEFHGAHADMSEALKKELAKYVDDMVKATKKLMADIRARQKERNAEVADLLEAYKTERERMAANWQSLTATMAKKRGGKPVVSASAEVKTVEEAVEKPKKKEIEKVEKKARKDKKTHPLTQHNWK